MAVVGLLMGYGPDENPMMANPSAFMLVNVIAVFPLLVWGWWRSGERPLDTLGLKAFPWGVIPAIVPLGIGAALLMSELDNLIRWLLPGIPSLFGDIFQDLFDRPLLGLLVVVVMAPLTEEPLFRGVILRGLLRRHGPWASSIVCSLLFGLIHINPPQVIAASLLGLLLAAVYLNTRSLWPCVALHAVVNAVPLAAFGLVPDEIEIQGLTTPPEAGVFHPPWLDALAIMLFVLGLVGFWAATRKVPSNDTVATHEGPDND
jgi:membrane protease YdiL (CAAX protease family)